MLYFDLLSIKCMLLHARVIPFAFEAAVLLTAEVRSNHVLRSSVGRPGRLATVGIVIYYQEYYAISSILSFAF